MKKIYWIIATAIILIVGFTVILVQGSNALVIDGITRDTLDQTVIISVENKGLLPLRIENIATNKLHTTKDMEWGISYTAHLVLGANLDDIAFEPLKKPLLPQALSAAQKQNIIHANEQNTPLHYGIRIANSAELTTVKISYKYLGFPFSRTVEVSE